MELLRESVFIILSCTLICRTWAVSEVARLDSLGRADVTSPVQLEAAFYAAHELLLPPLPGDTLYIHSERRASLWTGIRGIGRGNCFQNRSPSLKHSEVSYILNTRFMWYTGPLGKDEPTANAEKTPGFVYDHTQNFIERGYPESADAFFEGYGPIRKELK